MELEEGEDGRGQFPNCGQRSTPMLVHDIT